MSDYGVISKLRAALAVLIVIIIAIGALLATSISSVGVGEAVVIIDPLQGRIVDVKFGPQLFLKLPWQTTIKVLTAVKAINMFFEPPRDYPAVAAITSDGAKVEVDITVRYKVVETPDAVKELVTNYPLLNFEDAAIVPAVREETRNMVSNYTLTDIIEKRSVISAAIVNAVIQRLTKDPTLKNAITIIDVAVRNLEPPAEVVAAINKKLAAEQEAKAAEYNRTKILIIANATAQQRILEAEGEAQATLLRADAEAKSILLKANATAESLELIAKVLNSTDALVNYLYFETLKKLVEEGGQVQVVLISGGGGQTQTPIIYPIPTGRD